MNRGDLASAAWQRAARAEREHEAWRAVAVAIEATASTEEARAMLPSQIRFNDRTLRLAGELLDQITTQDKEVAELGDPATTGQNRRSEPADGGPGGRRRQSV